MKILDFNGDRSNTKDFFPNCRIQVSVWLMFGVIVVIYLSLTFITSQHLLNEEILQRSYPDQISWKNIQKMLDLQNQYWWLGYIFQPFAVFIKVSFTTVCVSIGAVMYAIKIKFKTIFEVAVISELVFVGFQILYLLNISMHMDALTLENAANYYPFSLLSYFGVENVVTWLRYPLQTLNLFEAFYIIAISWLLSKQWKPGFVESLSIVLPSYATGLILWLALVTFLTIQVS